MDIESLTAGFGVVTEYAIVVIDILAFIAILIGTVQAFASGMAAAARGADNHTLRFIWIRYARWLVAGLTFQLGADIIESAIAPTWEEIGKLGAVAVIRTFLNFFLDRDIAEIREQEEKAALRSKDG